MPSAIEVTALTKRFKDVVAVDIPSAADCIRFFAEYADKLGGDVLDRPG